MAEDALEDNLEPTGLAQFIGLHWLKFIVCFSSMILFIGFFAESIKGPVPFHEIVTHSWLGAPDIGTIKRDRAREDLDIIESAIHLHDACNRPLIGYSLSPLAGRYLQEIPLDPWGNDYLVDADIKLLISFGSDGLSGGVRADEDVYSYYSSRIGNSKLRIHRVQYEGSWGIPEKGNEVIITMTKPFTVTSGRTVENTLNLLTDLREQDRVIAEKGNPVRFSEINKSGEVPPNWKAGVPNQNRQISSGSEARDERHLESRSRFHNPSNGILSLYNDTNAEGRDVQVFSPTMALNFDLSISPTTFGGEYGMIETSVPGGPLTSSIYGPGVMKYYRAPAPVPLYNGENRGVKIERF